ncbi:WXG100 family type VII secretion target [Nocardia salmonicida]|uniref:WXG100 family type VII secretion target n=1 Tax=Nocardia salmonicida TaxID=53431 RepID=UPI0037225A0B
MGFNATPAEIDAFSIKMNKKHADIEDMIKRSESHAANVNSPAFTGSAGTAFQQAMQDYLASARTLNNSLDQAADTVKSIAGLITDQEVEAAQGFAGVDAGGPQLDMKP